MSRRKKNTEDQSVTDYRYSEKRKNNPPAGLAAKGRVQDAPKARYSYDPHLPPVLRFDETGDSDQLPELLEIAKQRALTPEEAQMLAEALRKHQPWLEWAGKREKDFFEVDPVALHIHERISAQAILKLAQREPMQRSLFADPELEYRQAIQFYKHDVDWANRLILGDSMTVMHSLAYREDLAGKVQMIFIDPPYGIKFSSNFQPEITNKDVKEKTEYLTRELEQIKAYRDTWTLGVHSYLDYLRDRLSLAKVLLADSGSVFVQISDENLHRVRMLLDEIFGYENFVGVIAFLTTTGRGAKYLDNVYDYLLWYGKDEKKLKYHQLYSLRTQDMMDERYVHLRMDDGSERRLSKDELNNPNLIPAGSRFRLSGLTSQGATTSETSTAFEFQGEVYRPSPNRHWSTKVEGLRRLVSAERITTEGRSLVYKRLNSDAVIVPIRNLWQDTGGGALVTQKIYVVQTTEKVVERCLLMTTDPGDLVLDPTCGSGTTAYVAEQWGRRWITIDTSRVAIALARQRLLTSKYDFYELADADAGPSGGLVYKTASHITLKSIAQNQALDPIFARYEPILAEQLSALNQELTNVTPQLRRKLEQKLAEKEEREGKRSITEADNRRWILPQSEWKEWEVPYDYDPDWPDDLKKALETYRNTWRQKMDEVNATIEASAPQEVLVDQPKVISGIMRVSGPFTVEGVQPIEETLDLETPIGGEPEELETFSEDAPTNEEAYLEKMIRLLKQDGVRFPDNKVNLFSRLDPLPNSILHAEGEWGTNGDSRRVAVSFGPQYGPLTAKQVEECLHTAVRRGFDDLVFAAFSIDGAAQGIIQDDPNPMVQCHLAHIRPDVQMGNLLKDTPNSQLFTVFGLPRVQVCPAGPGEWTVEMEGVDIYDPVNNTITATRADKVAAWFLDSDYDGRTFCITQAFFPDKTAWDKIARALKSSVNPELFGAFSGTKSLPFKTGDYRRIAVKVIDPRGNEVVRVMSLEA